MTRPRPLARAGTASRAIALLLLAGALLAQDEGGGPGAALPSAESARAKGIESLADVLPHVDAADPGLRVAARRLARTLIADFHAAALPEGMRLVPGRLHLTPGGARCDGGFFLGEREVTRGAFRAFAAERGWKRESWDEGSDDLPATDVSLFEARAFAAAAGARLPTRDELLYAATGGGRNRYPWGDESDPSRANTREAGRGGLLAAGALPAGASPHGVLDLVGNAAEWTETPVGRDYVFVAGGSYRSAQRPVAADTFCTYRLAPEARLPDVGFRLARALPPLPDGVRLGDAPDAAPPAPPEPEPEKPPPGTPLQAPPADGGS